MLTECVTRFFGKGLVHNVLRGCSIVLLDVVPDVHHGGHEGLGAALVVEYVVAAERQALQRQGLGAWYRKCFRRPTALST